MLTHALRRLGPAGLLTSENVRALYPELLKRLDDASDDVLSDVSVASLTPNASVRTLQSSPPSLAASKRRARTSGGGSDAGGLGGSHAGAALAARRVSRSRVLLARSHAARPTRRAYASPSPSRMSASSIRAVAADIEGHLAHRVSAHASPAAAMSDAAAPE